MYKSSFVLIEKKSCYEIVKISPLQFSQYTFYLDNRIAGTFHRGAKFVLSKAKLTSGRHILLIIASYILNGVPYENIELLVFYISHSRKPAEQEIERNFKPGDILVASDNSMSLPPGLMGHSAIVADEAYLVESPGYQPAVRKTPISHFLAAHPLHAQYRPKSLQLGEKAAGYAISYYKRYMENIKNGINSPQFSFSLTSPLKNPDKYIYCSKLVWLSYYYGAHYEFKNDFLWFSPEDLNNALQNNKDFELIYKHPAFGFKLNT